MNKFFVQYKILHFLRIKIKIQCFQRFLCPKNFCHHFVVFSKCFIFLNSAFLTSESFFYFYGHFFLKFFFCFGFFRFLPRKVKPNLFMALYEVYSSINKALKLNFRKSNLFDDSLWRVSSKIQILPLFRRFFFVF